MTIDSRTVYLIVLLGLASLPASAAPARGLNPRSVPVQIQLEPYADEY